MRNDYNKPISRARRYELEKEYETIDQKHFREGEKIIMEKWAGVQFVIKSQLTRHFNNEEELQNFLLKNPQYTINQRYGHWTEKINVEFYERAYAVTELNPYGYRVPIRWLTEEEVTEYLKDQQKEGK